MGFYEDISWESRYNSEINVWAHFFKILFVLCVEMGQVVIQDHLEKGEGFAYILAKIWEADCTPRTQINFNLFSFWGCLKQIKFYYLYYCFFPSFSFYFPKSKITRFENDTQIEAYIAQTK